MRRFTPGRQAGTAGIAVSALAALCSALSGCWMSGGESHANGGDADGDADTDTGSGTDTEGACPLHVAPWGGAADEVDGRSWETAYDSVVDAMRLAADLAPCEVWVAAGTYYLYRLSPITDTVRLASGVSLLGGFTGAETDASERDPAENQTVLDGRNGPDGEQAVYHVLQADSEVDDSALVDGFTIQHGVAAGDFPNSMGGGLEAFEASPVIARCRFTHNTAGIGGALTSRYGSPTIRDSIFDHNSASYHGAVHCYLGGHLTVERGVFYDNSGNSEGGAVSASNSCWLTVVDSEFHDNSSGSGGAIWLGSPACSGGDVTSSVFARNGAYDGAALLAEEGCDVEIVNSTFAENVASYEGSGALYAYEGATVSVVGSVFWGNAPMQIASVGGVFSVSHSDVQGGFDGFGNLDADPLFSNPDWLDYSIGDGSPCIDAADGEAAPGTDIAGHARYDHPEAVDAYDCEDGDPACCPFADIGAWEYVP